MLTADTHLSKDLSSSNELSHSASWWDERGEHTEQGDSLKVGPKKIKYIKPIMGIRVHSGGGKLNIHHVGASKGDG